MDKKTEKITAGRDISIVGKDKKAMLLEYMAKNGIKLQDKELAAYGVKSTVNIAGVKCYGQSEVNPFQKYGYDNAIVIDMTYDDLVVLLGNLYNNSQFENMTKIIKRHKKPDEQHESKLWSKLGNCYFGEGDVIGAVIIYDKDLADLPIVLVDYEHMWRQENTSIQIQTYNKPIEVGIGTEEVNRVELSIEPVEIKPVTGDEGNIQIEHIDIDEITQTINTSLRMANKKPHTEKIQILPESVDMQELAQVIKKAINNTKDKIDTELKIKEDAKIRTEIYAKNVRELSEKIDIKEYINMLYERIRQTDYMYRKSDIVNLINSIMTQQGVDLRGVSGIGKDSIAKIFCMLSCENYDEQVLEISASIGLELDDKRVLGYQDAFTHEYQDSNYLTHMKKSNKDSKKPFFYIITEANLVNLDKSLSPITSSMDSAFKKITRPRYGNINSDTDPDPEFTDNDFMFLTTNDYKERKDLSLKDRDRMMIIGYNDPYLRRIKDRSGEKYKPLSSEPILAELFKKHILNNEFRKMSIRDARYNNGDYKIWEDKYNDVIAELYEKLNGVLKRNHMENLQIANRLQDATNKYLFVATLLPIDEKFDKEEYKDFATDEKLVMNQKLVFDRFLCQKFMTKLEDATYIHLKGLKEIKEILSEESKSETSLLHSEAECIKMLENIIWRIKSYEQQYDSELGFIDQPEDD